MFGPRTSPPKPTQPAIASHSISYSPTPETPASSHSTPTSPASSISPQTPQGPQVGDFVKVLSGSAPSTNMDLAGDAIMMPPVTTHSIPLPSASKPSSKPSSPESIRSVHVSPASSTHHPKFDTKEPHNLPSSSSPRPPPPALARSLARPRCFYHPCVAVNILVTPASSLYLSAPCLSRCVSRAVSRAASRCPVSRVCCASSVAPRLSLSFSASRSQPLSLVSLGAPSVSLILRLSFSASLSRLSLVSLSAPHLSGCVSRRAALCALSRAAPPCALSLAMARLCARPCAPSPATRDPVSPLS